MSARLNAQTKRMSASSVLPTRSGILQRKCACGGSAGLHGECAGCRRERKLGQPGAGLQTKLTINRPGDKYEREADRVAAQVMRMPGPEVTGTDGSSPRPLVQRRAATSSDDVGTADVPPSVDSVLRSPGRPLDPSTRQFMESRFGHDFGRVRVHTDAQSAEAATAVNARAFTVANDIVFRGEDYAPETATGRGLLAHELTHVIQQSTNRDRPTLQRQNHEPPTFPDVPGLVNTLSDDIGKNLYDYGHHFYRIATLYPDQPVLLQDAFARYALGTNVLGTGYSFIGASPGTADVLALVSGISFKGVNFLRTGALVIDYQLDLGGDVKLETAIDLAVNPNDYTEVKSVNAGVSLVGHF